MVMAGVDALMERGVMALPVDIIEYYKAMLDAAPLTDHVADAGKMVVHGHSARELFMCSVVMHDLAASDMKDLADGLMEFRFEDENGCEGCFDVSIAEYAAKTASILDSIAVAKKPAPDVSMLVGVLEKCRELISPLERDCSCHISPPCADCVDYGFERELADEIDAALAAYRQQGGEA